MKVAMLLKCDNGMWALDDASLSRLVYFATSGYTQALKEQQESKTQPSEPMIEFNDLLRFLRNPYKED